MMQHINNRGACSTTVRSVAAVAAAAPQRPPQLLMHCNTLQHTATRCNTRQHAATHCNMIVQSASAVATASQPCPPQLLMHRNTTNCNMLHHTAPYCNPLPPTHTATHTCMTLQHTCATTVHSAATVAAEALQRPPLLMQCNTLQNLPHAATQYNTATHICMTLQHTCARPFKLPLQSLQQLRSVLLNR